MSFHVYIARQGFKETPIPKEDWIGAANHCDLLLVEEKTNRKGTVSYTVSLKADKKQRLSLDVYGLIHAQNPSRELVEVMFLLAQRLESKVYSERLKAYESVKDWERRTRDYRQRREESISEHRARYRRKLFWWALVIIVGLAIGLIKG